MAYKKKKKKKVGEKKKSSSAYALDVNSNREQVTKAICFISIICRSITEL